MKRFLAVLIVVMMMVLAAGQAWATITCTQAMSTAFKGNAMAGLYQKGDTYKIAFIKDSGSGTYNAATDQYSDISADEMTGTNQGPYTLDSIAYGTSGTTYWIDFADEVNNTVTFAAASGCAIIYDDTAANTSCTASGAPYPCCSGSGAGTCQDSVIGVFSFTPVQPSAGTLTVTFPAADASNAVIRLAVYDWIQRALIAGSFEAPTISWHRDAVVKLKGISAKGFFNNH